jgi:hypothetical protein
LIKPRPKKDDKFTVRKTKMGVGAKEKSAARKTKAGTALKKVDE